MSEDNTKKAEQALGKTIVIQMKYIHRDEAKELIDYLEENCWDYSIEE